MSDICTCCGYDHGCADAIRIADMKYELDKCKDAWKRGNDLIEVMEEVNNRQQQRIAELEADVQGYGEAYTKMMLELQAENERLRRPACGTEQVWLDTIRHDDEQAIAWFRAMQRESEGKKKAIEENERLRDALDECADDLESYVEHEYVSMHDYPDIHRRYERDIEPVRKARKLLAASETLESRIDWMVDAAMEGE